MADANDDAVDRDDLSALESGVGRSVGDDGASTAHRRGPEPSCRRGCPVTAAAAAEPSVHASGGDVAAECDADLGALA